MGRDRARFQSHALAQRGRLEWRGVAPYAPVKAPLALSNEAAHRELDFIVPDTAQSGPFKVVTLGTLESNSYEVAARRFSAPVTLSAPDRAGLRPAVARDASNGDRIVAWIDHNDRGGNQLVASVLAANAAAFTTPVVIAADIGGLPGAPPRPAVAAAGGKFYVAWVSGASGNDEVVFATSLDGLNWSAPVNLSNSRSVFAATHARGRRHLLSSSPGSRKARREKTRRSDFACRAMAAEVSTARLQLDRRRCRRSRSHGARPDVAWPGAPKPV